MSRRRGAPDRRLGSRRGSASQYSAQHAAEYSNQHAELDTNPVQRGPLLDERLRPVPVKRSKDLGRDMRVDPTRVSGPIRLVLEPMLWLAFLSGVVWALVALDPGVRSPGEGVVFFEHSLPLAIIVAALLLISTISALMWLTVSTTATRARTSFAGLGMLASGWLFARVDPVDTQDLLGMSWLSIAVGALLVAICAVPWPTSPSPVTRRLSTIDKAVLGVLSVVVVVIAYLAWEAAQLGLVGMRPGAETGWDALLPLLGTLVIVMAGARHLLRRPVSRQ